ncbi:MAG: type IV pilus twitching motility protein PilT [Anaerolineales bacterium]
MTLETLLTSMNDTGASDLHLKVDSPPVLRVDGELHPIAGVPALTGEEVLAVFRQLTDESQREAFEAARELDFSYEGARARFRVNASMQRGTISLALRRLSLQIPTLEQLNLPPICAELAVNRQGLVLLTGPTGSGKSTTLAAMIEHINRTEARRVVTIEDPIEYVHSDQRSIITQREVGRDTNSFAMATRQALRQDPDVILVGEMRDRETMAACLTAAETGHLVLSTLHTNSGPETIDRIVDTFPAHQQGQIRMQLSLTLVAALSQALLPRLDGQGRVPALEIMIASNAIRNLIREGKTHQMAGVMQTARQSGMQTMDQALVDLYRQGLIDIDSARSYAHDASSLQALLAG